MRTKPSVCSLASSTGIKKHMRSGRHMENGALAYMIEVGSM
jgi:hypothetical protein